MAKQLPGIATSAESEAVKLAAVRDALDRAGLKPPAQVELSAKPPEPWEELLGDVMAITKAQHEAWKRGEYQPATPAPLPDPPALAAPVDDDVLDAEVVEPSVSPPSADEDDADAPSVPELGRTATGKPYRPARATRTGHGGSGPSEPRSAG
jgi:hypothetical protein